MPSPVVPFWVVEEMARGWSGEVNAGAGSGRKFLGAADPEGRKVCEHRKAGSAEALTEPRAGHDEDIRRGAPEVAQARAAGSPASGGVC
jgi:hypothetical protein